MFRLLQSNHHQAVYQKYRKEIMLHLGSGQDLGLTKLLRMYVSLFITRNIYTLYIYIYMSLVRPRSRPLPTCQTISVLYFRYRAWWWLLSSSRNM